MFDISKGNNKITENSEQSSKVKVKTHKYINRLWTRHRVTKDFNSSQITRGTMAI